MSVVIPPGYGQASIEIRNSGDPDPWYVTFGVDLDNVGGDYQAAATTIAATFAQTIGLQFHTSTATTGCNLVIGQDGPDNLIARGTLSGSNTGTSTAAMLPQNCAALYDKVTTLAGRRGRGRMFLPNILPEGEVDQVGVISNDLRDDLQLQADAFLEDLSVGPAPTPMVLLHGPGAGSGLETPTLITALNVQSTISTQRRRLR